MPSICDKYQSKSITPVDDYVCTLSKELQQKAKDELGETPERRAQALEEFREWIWNNPRIEKCRMDSTFILKFLRVTKYKMVASKEMFERYLIFREGLYGQDWFTNLDTQRPGVQELLDKGLYVFLPNYSKTGERIILMQSKALNGNIKNLGNVLFSLMTMVMELLLDDEENQVRGYRLFMDLSGVRLSHYFMFNFSTWLRIMKHVERTFTARHKGCHIFKLSSALVFVAKIFLNHVKDKMKSVITFPSCNEEIDFVDRENLPKEYGGNQSMEKLIDDIKHRINSRRDLYLSYGNMKVDHEYYKEAVIKCDIGSLNYRLENPEGNLLNKYEPTVESDEDVK